MVYKTEYQYASEWEDFKICGTTQYEYDKNGNTIYLKDETKQYTNAFKYRGVYNKLNKIDFKNYNGVITSSTGNHGQAVSLVAKQLNIRCEIGHS